MPEYRFETHSPVNLVVEISKGNVNVRCTDTTESTVVVEGKHAEDVVVEQHGDSITVIEPGRGRIFGDNALRVDVVVPRTEQPRDPHRLGRHPGRGPRRPRAAAQRLRRLHPRDRRGPPARRDRLRRDPGRRRARQPQGQERLRRRRGRRGRRHQLDLDRLRRRRPSRRPAAHRRQDRQRRPERRRRARRHVVQHRQRRRRRSTWSTAAGSPSRAPPATCRSASRPASRCGPTSPPCPAPSAPTCRAPASPRRARTTSRSAPRPSAATSR